MGSEEDFVYEFPFEKRQGNIYTPKANINIKSFDNTLEENYQGIIDTGSEITLISDEIIHKFKFPSTGKQASLKTASASQPIKIISCYGQIGFRNENSRHYSIVIFSCKREYLEQDIILGMNYIIKYKMCLCGDTKKLIVQERRRPNNK